MSTVTVHVKETVLISPSEHTPNHTLKLSDLDAQLDTVQHLLVYSPSHDHGDLDRVATTNNVKSALRRALVLYYPLAGRVSNRADGRGLEVLCQAQGALFVEAVSDSTVSEFKKLPQHEAKWREFLPVDELNVLKGAPPLAVQLTWLSDGGATLGFGFSHCMCDGIGAGKFHYLFSELALGRLADHQVPEPAWSRHLMDLPPSDVSTHANSSLIMHRHPELTINPDSSGSTSRYAKERLTPTLATLDSSKLNDLKKQVVGFKCTSFVVLTAHIWRSWARALNLPSDQMVKLVLSVDIRNRVKPTLPDGYYGNAYVLVCAQTCVRDLIEKDLGYVAKLVMRAIESVDEEYVREVVELVSTGETRIDMEGTLIISQWTRLGLDHVDFGMGRPAQVWPERHDICILLPVSNLPNAVNVHMGVPSDAVEQYLYFLGNTSCLGGQNG